MLHSDVTTKEKTTFALFYGSRKTDVKIDHIVTYLQYVTSGTPTNSSLMEFSYAGLVVKQPSFYVVIPVFPDPDPYPPFGEEPARIAPKIKFWDEMVGWFDKGDEIHIETTSENMNRVPGTIIRVKQV